ncbi:FAD-binding oxidoreductase [Kribbella sp. NPDC055071]
MNVFSGEFLGELVWPDSAGYDEARRVWNGHIDKRPALIARCSGTADVQAALRYAREHELVIAVRGGGHNVAGRSTCDGGVVIDLGLMQEIRIDTDARTATVAPGVIWRDLDAATQEVGLALPGGTVSDTGVAGLTLGGGLGWLSRRVGLTCDSLISAELVTADSTILRVDEHDHPDLMWALRGGGGSVGVVTSFEFRLHELNHPVLAGALFYTADKAPELLRFVRDWAADAPRSAALMAMLGTAPPAPFLPAEMHGQPMAMVQAVWTGAPSEGEAALAALRAFGPPVVDLVGPLPYTALQQATDVMAPRGHQYYLKASFLDALDDTVIEAALKAQQQFTSPTSGIGFTLIGGAVGDIDDGAFSHRDANWMCDILTSWAPNDPNAEPHLHWARDLWENLEPTTRGGYVNHLATEELLTRRGYNPQTATRLATIKTTHDPDNIF